MSHQKTLSVSLPASIISTYMSEQITPTKGKSPSSSRHWIDSILSDIEAELESTWRSKHDFNEFHELNL